MIAFILRLGLHATECVYLVANGWSHRARDSWDPPEKFRKYEGEFGLRHGHAINRQKWHDNNPRGDS